MSKRNPMPHAHVTLICDECNAAIVTLELLTDRLARELFAERKKHAKEQHGWEELE